MVLTLIYWSLLLNQPLSTCKQNPSMSPRFLTLGTVKWTTWGVCFFRFGTLDHTQSSKTLWSGFTISVAYTCPHATVPHCKAVFWWDATYSSYYFIHLEKKKAKAKDTLGFHLTYNIEWIEHALEVVITEKWEFKKHCATWPWSRHCSLERMQATASLLP